MSNLEQLIKASLSSKVLKVLQDSPTPLSAAEIAVRVDSNSRSVAMALRRLTAKGEVQALMRARPTEYVA